MSLRAFSDSLPYVAILVAAIVEGEIAYIAACALVAAGRLDAIGVILTGALGAAIGDQAYFYVFRRRLAQWIARFPALERKVGPLVPRVRRSATLMVLLIRFAPGLRVALAAACAYVDMSPLRFSILNGVTSILWAIGLLVLVAWLGPAGLAKFGLEGWKAAVLVGVLILLFFRWLNRVEQQAMAQ